MANTLSKTKDESGTAAATVVQRDLGSSVMKAEPDDACSANDATNLATKMEEMKSGKDEGATCSKKVVDSLDFGEHEDQPSVLDSAASGIEKRATAYIIDADGEEQHGGAHKRKRSRPTRVVTSRENEHEERVGSQGNDHTDSSYGHIKAAVPRTHRQEPDISEYERERLENIRKNQEMLQFLELPTAVTAIKLGANDNRSHFVTKDQELPSPSVRIQKQKLASKIIMPVRVSSRLRGLPVLPVEIGENDAVDSAAEQIGRHQTRMPEEPTIGDSADEEDTGKLMSGDLFFDEETRKKAIRVDGHYKGWLNADVMERYGFEESAQAAWEANGGGTFSFKDPLGLSESAASVKSKSSKRPKHDAKMVAKTMFKKNPNAFFYRHNEPGQEQWTGDWTPEEGKLFLAVAKEFGCGDKWGLFASHIPHRVGYQCSNYYRQIVLPEGLVFDPNYEYTSGGKPIYCGKYNQRRE